MPSNAVVLTKELFRAEYKRLFLDALSSHEKFNDCVIKRYTEDFQKKYPGVDFCQTLFSDDPSILLNEDENRYGNFFDDDRDKKTTPISQFILDVVHFAVVQNLKNQAAIQLQTDNELREAFESRKATSARKAIEASQDENTKHERAIFDAKNLEETNLIRDAFFKEWDITSIPGAESCLHIQAFEAEAKNIWSNIQIQQDKAIDLFTYENGKIIVNSSIFNSWVQEQSQPFTADHTSYVNQANLRQQQANNIEQEAQRQNNLLNPVRQDITQKGAQKTSRFLQLLKISSVMTFLTTLTMAGLILGAGVVPALTFAGFGATLGLLAGPIGMAIGALVGAAVGFSIAAAVIGATLAIGYLLRNKKTTGYQPVSQDIESGDSMRSLSQLGGSAQNSKDDVKTEKDKTYSFGRFFMRLVKIAAENRNTKRPY